MTQTEAVRMAFPELNDLEPIQVRSGQKEVFFGSLDAAPVVLKLVKITRDEATSEGRLIREIEAAATLDSEYVPTVHHHGRREVAGLERVFVIEERVSGQTLREHLSAGRSFDYKDFLEFAETLLGACCDFERQQLVHRDIKPSNLMVDETGKMWVIDFGLVRFLEHESLTATGDQFGPCTPGYGSPEQMRNRKQEIDIRADLFAVGVTLYELATGANPHRSNPNLLAVIRSVETTDLPRLVMNQDSSGSVGDLVASLASRFRTRRPRSAADALAWLLEARNPSGGE